MSLKYKTLLIGLYLALAFIAMPLRAQVLPLEQKNTIGADWLVQESGEKQLVPYTAGLHTNFNAIHQWVSINPAQPFVIGFTAKKGECLFLNNQLIFIADSASNYTINLAKYTKQVQPVNRKFLLTVWHPAQQPDISTFQNKTLEPDKQQQAAKSTYSVKLREYVNQNAFILFMLLVGLIYGSLKTSYPADFNSVFRLSSFIRTNTLEEGFLAKPISTWSSVLFVLAFSISFALLIAAIHTNIQHIRLFNRLFPVSEADITTKIIFYTVAIFLFILIKYFFLRVMAFIFGLEQVVQLQYREFLRTILFLSIFLPLVMLLYLALNMEMPETVLLISNLAVSFMLAFTMLRVFVTVNKKAPVLNLHLFSYLCATEVIPLVIILKLIVFNF
ncbi:DUF4271 domain-containing protein [Pontibacter vulgaris]|uniref:DUF4271 domain-containing protein n=1 Tax=Pontibacter vulgaris TaxID=2905679 RepID=UPI001FA6C6C9|nr:DUF4271 domain-containing protein [Pontibacter vulgaris]